MCSVKKKSYAQLNEKAVRYAKAVGAEKERLAQEIIAHAEAESLVKRIASFQISADPVVDLNDLCQSGKIGLIKALKKFKPEKEVLFTTYARWWIRLSIQRHEGL